VENAHPILSYLLGLNKDNMKRKYTLLLLLLCMLCAHLSWSQQDSASKRMVLVPFAPFMYFSDADMHLSQANRKSEQQVREQIRNEVEADVYHQLLARFDVVSLMRATTLSGEDDLRRVYGTTTYVKYNARAQKDRKLSEDETLLTRYTQPLYKRQKGQRIFAQDTNVMVAVFNDIDVYRQLMQRHKADYLIFTTQFEMNTSHKNTLEWQYRDYQREYVIHYNVFNRAGELVRAEVISVVGGKENDLNTIKQAYIAKLAEKIKFITNELNR
jgi:hypothetical protein